MFDAVTQRMTYLRVATQKVHGSGFESVIIVGNVVEAEHTGTWKDNNGRKKSNNIKIIYIISSSDRDVFYAAVNYIPIIEQNITRR